MKEHDYAAALQAWEDIHAADHKALTDEELTVLLDRAFNQHEVTIRHALRFAEKMCGPPTNNMVTAGMIALGDAGVDDAQEYDALKCLEAMRDAALKELGE